MSSSLAQPEPNTDIIQFHLSVQLAALSGKQRSPWRFKLSASHWAYAERALSATKVSKGSKDRDVRSKLSNNSFTDKKGKAVQHIGISSTWDLPTADLAHLGLHLMLAMSTQACLGG